jgi:hypothetical protein
MGRQASCRGVYDGCLIQEGSASEERCSFEEDRDGLSRVLRRNNPRRELPRSYAEGAY